MNLFYFKRKSDDTIYDRTTITDGADIVYNNDTELFTYNTNNRNYHFYNSAVYVHDANNDPSIMAYEALIIVRNSGISLNSPSGINGQLNTNRNGYYSTSYFIYVPESTVDDGGFRNAWSSAVDRNTWDFINESNIPTFTDYNEYLAYTQGPYYDPHAKVKVNYMIPEGDYQYCKLTYKADYQPENQNDGTSIDISPNASSVNVEGLDENQLYYFTLFTDKSESEPFPFVVGEPPIPSHPYLLPSDDTIFKIRQNGNATGIDMTIGQIKQSLLAASSTWQTPFSTFVLYNGRTTSGYYVWGFSAPLDGDIKLYDKSGLNERYSENPNIYYITAFEYVPRHSFANRSFYQFILKSNSETELEYTNYNTDINSRTSNVEKKEEGEYIPGFEITNDTYLPIVFVTNTQNFTNIYINDIKVN